MRLIAPLFATILLLISPSFMRADLLNLGVVSFDNLIPPLQGPGLNAFDVSNFTGDPATTGFAIPPDFPSLTPVTFRNSQLTLVGSTTQVIPLGDIGPGFLVPGAEFLDSEIFSSAEFSATLDQTTFLLVGGGSFAATSAVVDVFLTPSSGSTLGLGDSALITVSNVPAAVPEPKSWLLLGTVGLSFWVLRRISSIPRP